jgi:hypothetical protein
MSRAGGNSQHRVVAVADMAGAGTTVLACGFAVQNQDAYHAVWWIDAERRDASPCGSLAILWRVPSQNDSMVAPLSSRHAAAT